MEELNKCTCNESGNDEHFCPYQTEINDDPEYTCTCCAYCEYQCLMDI